MQNEISSSCFLQKNEVSDFYPFINKMFFLLREFDRCNSADFFIELAHVSQNSVNVLAKKNRPFEDNKYSLHFWYRLSYVGKIKLFIKFTEKY